MELKNQVVSLDIARKMKELGFEQESLFAYYSNAGTWHDALVEVAMYKDADAEFKKAKLLPAYTVAELGEMLAQYGTYGSWKTTKSKKWAVTKINEIEYPEFDSDTEADARAKILIYLKEQKLI